MFSVTIHVAHYQKDPSLHFNTHSLLKVNITNRAFSRHYDAEHDFLHHHFQKHSPLRCYRHSLVEAKITNVLSLCHDPVILNAVQAIILNLVACEDQHAAHQALYHLQGCGFGGLWRFAGPFTKVRRPFTVYLLDLC
jgi:hypothetical protein